MSRPVRSSRKAVCYNEAVPPSWICDPWIACLKGYLDKWAVSTPVERLALIEPMWEFAMSSPECVAYFARFRDVLAYKLRELAVEASAFGKSFRHLQRKVNRFLRELKKHDCYRTVASCPPRRIVMGIPVVMGIPIEAPPPVVAPALVVAPPELMVAPALVVEEVAPSVAEEISVTILAKVGALESELTNRKRAHEEDVATLRALLAEKDVEIAALKDKIRKSLHALL